MAFSQLEQGLGPSANPLGHKPARHWPSANWYRGLQPTRKIQPSAYPDLGLEPPGNWAFCHHPYGLPPNLPNFYPDRLVGWRPNRPNEGLIGGQLTNAGSALTFANRFLGAFLPGCQGLRLCLSDDTSELRAIREEKRLRAEKWLGVLNQLLRQGSHKIMHSLT